MFTTGSKFFFGASALSLVSAFVYAQCTSGPTSMMGCVGLLSVSAIFGFLGGVNYFNRDGNVPGMEPGVELTSAAAQPPVSASMWPLITAAAVGGLVVGVVSKPMVFKVSVVVLLAAIVEWMVLGWSERASGDRSYNLGIRRRLLYPLEFPILGAVGLGALIYSFSRIMLWLDEDGGKIAFGVIGALVLFGGFAFVGGRRFGKRAVAGICTVAAVALLGFGVASAVQGQREIEEHPTTIEDPEVCLEEGTNAHIDDDASQAVAAKSNVIANIYLQSNGVVVAGAAGSNGEYTSSISVPRSAMVRIRFHNDYDTSERLTARLGTFGTADEAIMCTTAVTPDHEAFLEFKVPKTNAASSTPLQLLVPGLEGQVIEIVVP